MFIDYTFSTFSFIHFYKRDDRGIRVPIGAGSYSLLHRLQAGSGTHSASYPVGTIRIFFLEQSGRGVRLTTHLHPVPRPRMRGAILPLNQHAFMAWYLIKAQGQIYLCLCLYLYLRITKQLQNKNGR